MSDHPNRAKVAEFHEAFGITTPAERSEDPSLPPQQDQEDYHDLMHIANRLADLAGFAHMAAESAEHQKDPMKTVWLRIQLMTEELGEVVAAFAKRDVPHLAHELADLEYVVQGTVLAFGFDPVFEDCVAEVHRANMSKLEDGKPVLNAAGRVQKGKHFRPADVSGVLMRYLRETAA